MMVSNAASQAWKGSVCNLRHAGEAPAPAEVAESMAADRPLILSSGSSLISPARIAVI